VATRDAGGSVGRSEMRVTFVTQEHVVTAVVDDSASAGLFLALA
jgi:hypothetical protein